MCIRDRYKNWDTVKEKLSELWSNIKEKFEAIKETITGAFTKAKEAVTEKVKAVSYTHLDVYKRQVICG